MTQQNESHTSHSDPTDTSEFFGGSLPSAQWNQQGDSCRGIVVAKELRNATVDQPDGSTVIDRWPDGRPKKIAVVTLRPHYEGGDFNLYVRNWMQDDIKKAVQALGLPDLLLGCDMRVTWTSTDRPQGKKQGARHFTVDLAAPGEVLEDLLSEVEQQEPQEEPPF